MKKIIIHRSYIAAAVLILVLAGGIGGWIVHSRQKKPLPLPSPVAINASATNPATRQVATPNPNVGGGPGNGSGSTSSSPVYPPYGSFASNYSPTMSDQEQSTCNTTPGATCTISFTKDSVTKSLDARVVSDGNSKNAQALASWTWTPADIGLTTGTWKITATATLDGHQASTSSSKPLGVNQ